MQRHLAAFEALDAHAGARRLALAAAAAGLALARADAAADADALLGAPGLSAIWLSFIASILSLALDDADEMRHLGDHAAGRGVSGNS